MDVVIFGRALNELTVEDIRAIASDLAGAITSTADEIAVTRATLIIEQSLRRSHRQQNAAAAALTAATTVQEIAHKARVKLPDDDVTRVARAAAQLARGMVAGDNPSVEEAVRCLTRGWERLPDFASVIAA